jgi:ribonuclease D
VGLDERDRLLFNTLRTWRSRKAPAEGAPPYVILTNRELLGIVLRKPENRTALGQISGIGCAKVERYVKEILEALHGALRSEAALPRVTAAPAPTASRTTSPASEAAAAPPAMESHL